jgi:hypothetical protein
VRRQRTKKRLRCAPTPNEPAGRSERRSTTSNRLWLRSAPSRKKRSGRDTRRSRGPNAWLRDALAPNEPRSPPFASGSVARRTCGCCKRPTKKGLAASCAGHELTELWLRSAPSKRTRPPALRANSERNGCVTRLTTEKPTPRERATVSKNRRDGCSKRLRLNRLWLRHAPSTEPKSPPFASELVARRTSGCCERPKKKKAAT